MAMLKLHARLAHPWDAEPFIVRISTNYERPESARTREALVVRTGQDALPPGFRLYLRPEDVSISEVNELDLTSTICDLPAALGYLTDGDIIRVSPRYGELWVMYRQQSRFNSMLLTEQCNSDCIMCSQPPKAVDDSHLIRAYLEAIPLMDVATPELGITGGEPTLLGKPLLQLIAACRDCLPDTALHMLSNGRMFNYLSLCRDFAEIVHPNFVIGIPVYSDIASHHDFVVQAKGAFDQTIRGMMNLRRCGLRIELRVVLHRHTIDRLPQLARFIGRNLPFVEHVALMGLEMMGYVRMNLEALWIDPSDYRTQLMDAVSVLARHRMNVSIYNHQLCVLDRELWPFARKSISDWKNEYLEVCGDCAVRNDCGGFFASSSLKRSAHIRPVSATEFSCGADVGKPQISTV